PCPGGRAAGAPLIAALPTGRIGPIVRSRSYDSPMDLREATALERLGGGRYGVDLRQEFAIGGSKPNGGYMLACLGRAAVAAAGEAGATHEHPVSTGASYLRSPDLGPA